MASCLLSSPRIHSPPDSLMRRTSVTKVSGNRVFQQAVKAFLACSFANQDEEVVAFFKKLIRAFDIEPFAYDFQEPGSLEQKVIQNIQGCDCLIALATKRWRIGKSDEWALPSWV